jgi:polyferredoxin
MEKMHYPPGLIRNSTQNGVEQKLTRAAMFKRVLRPRVLLYTAVLMAVTTGLLWSLLTRSPFKVDVVRDRGAMARMVGQGQIENVYRLQIMNATEQGQRYALAVNGINGAHIVSDSEVVVDAAGSRWIPVRVQLPPNVSVAGSHPITFVISTLDTPRDEVIEKSVFLVPR